MSENENNYDLKTLAEKLRDVRFTIFTTRQGHELHGRPMTVLEATEQGSLWFFGVKESELVQEAAADPDVTLSFADNAKGTYAFVSGKAYLRDDRAKVEELWNPIHKAWYDGPDDSDLQLIEVKLESAEYWDSPDSGAVRFLGILKAAVTGDEHEVGEHGHVQAPRP